MKKLVQSASTPAPLSTCKPIFTAVDALAHMEQPHEPAPEAHPHCARLSPPPTTETAQCSDARFGNEVRMFKGVGEADLIEVIGGQDGLADVPG
ncbi:hypothetical protein [Streptomyces rimosus]|uniref:hypothetical protein n=1 Tax=Streptomyces rimosus TaxID=1927 RepID=UPI0037D52E86